MAGGLPSANAPKVVAAGFRPESAATLRLRMGAKIVQGNQPKNATRRRVLVRGFALTCSIVLWSFINEWRNMRVN